jgi:methionyl-tRNA synthetase
MVLTQKYFDGKVPAPGVSGEYEMEIEATVKAGISAMEQSIESFRFREALKHLMDIARTGNKYLADTEPWKIFNTDPEKVKTILYYSLQISAVLSVVAEPFLPFTCEKLKQMLNFGGAEWDQAGNLHLLKEGTELNKAFLLFDKIEDTAVEAQVNRLAETRKAQELAKSPVVPAKSPVTFEQFTSMDLRTATVLEAEKVPKTQKLLKLKVDTGIDVRTVVSGIAEYYNPEDIVGKQVCLLVNLEPRQIKGIESQGMILMAEQPDGSLVLVKPESESLPGSPVK